MPLVQGGIMLISITIILRIKTLQLTLINFVYMRLLDLRRIARIAMGRCTRKAKFEAVQRHYIKIYQSFFLLSFFLLVEGGGI